LYHLKSAELPGFEGIQQRKSPTLSEAWMLKVDALASARVLAGVIRVKRIIAAGDEASLTSSKQHVVVCSFRRRLACLETYFD
jgi:hypothetical protein